MPEVTDDAGLEVRNCVITFYYSYHVKCDRREELLRLHISVLGYILREGLEMLG